MISAYKYVHCLFKRYTVPREDKDALNISPLHCSPRLTVHTICKLTTLLGLRNAIYYYMDISVLLETKTLFFFIFSLREIWKTLCVKGPEFARALWFPPLLVLPLLVCSSQRGLLDSLWAFQMTIKLSFPKKWKMKIPRRKHVTMLLESSENIWIPLKRDETSHKSSSLTCKNPHEILLGGQEKMEESTNHPQSVGPVTVDLSCNHI